jgi:hypothetical protein
MRHMPRNGMCIPYCVYMWLDHAYRLSSVVDACMSQW